MWNFVSGHTRWSCVLILMFSSLFANTKSCEAMQSEDSPTAQPKIKMLQCQVLVVDPDGNPVSDATVYCTGMRTKAEPGSHWGWNPESHGPLPKLKTNDQGIVAMPYPEFVSEKLETGTMTWSVEHPNFVDFREDRSVADDPAEIKLERGYRIAATAINAQTGEKIKQDLYAVIGGSRASWKLAKNGMLVSPMFAPQATTLRICQFAEGQPTLFSESIQIDPGEKSRVLLKSIPLSPGTRVVGKLHDSIPRPVKNGQVSVSIIKRLDQGSWRNTWSWQDKTPIQEDGTFEFDSLPGDEVLQMIAVCDGWVPAMPEKAEVLEFFPQHAAQLSRGLSFPQLIKLEGEKVKPVLKMEQATSLQVTVRDPDGELLPETTVRMWPNQMWFDSGTQILGDGYSQREFLIKTRGSGYKWDRSYRYSGLTNDQGVTKINHLPASPSASVLVDHQQFEAPISGRSRSIEVELKPGEVNQLTVVMQPKGKDSLGESNDEGDD